MKQRNIRQTPRQLTSQGERLLSQSHPESGVASTEETDIVRKVSAISWTVMVGRSSRKGARVASMVPMV